MNKKSERAAGKLFEAVADEMFPGYASNMARERRIERIKKYPLDEQIARLQLYMLKKKWDKALKEAKRVDTPVRAQVFNLVKAGRALILHWEDTPSRFTTSYMKTALRSADKARDVLNQYVPRRI